MRVPFMSESDAFRMAYAVALLVGLSVALGAIVTPLAGAALCAGGLIGALLSGLSIDESHRPQPLREASRCVPIEGIGAPARGRVLVVANQTVGGRELKAEILKRRQSHPMLRIVVPLMCSRAHFVTSDIDRELVEAHARLDAMLSWARNEGFDARGAVGDANPLLAIEDELRRFGADELIISTHMPARSHWLEAGVVQRARDELDIPVTHVVVDVGDQRPVELVAS